MNKKLSGVFTAMITPFTKKNNLDEDALKEFIEWQIKEGIDGLVPCGTTGECATLSHLEHDRVIELTVRYTKGRVPVVAGTGSNDTREAIELSRHAQANGADACLVVNPYYNKPTQKGMYLHFKAIADSVDIPCILYNIKGRTGVNLATDTLLKLANDCKNIIGVKEASGDIVQIEDVIKRTNKDFIVFSGDDNMTVDIMSKGGDGVISVASNICPKVMKELTSQCLKKDFSGARKTEEGLAEFFKNCFIETNPIPIKTAMSYFGWCEEIFRLPMCTMEDSNKAVLIKTLEKLAKQGLAKRR